MKYLHLVNSGLVGSGAAVFRHYAASAGKSRLVQFLEGSLEEMLPEDFGNITTLSLYILNDMPGLKRVELADTITTIPDNALTNCPNIEEIVFPASISAINYVFALNGGLSEGQVICDFSKATKVPTITNYGTNTNATTFSFAKELRIPSALYSSWTAAEIWKNHPDKFVAV